MRLCGLGDNVVDRYVDLGLGFPGGNAVNVAVHARRNGADSSYVGVLGDDHAGDLVHSSLRSERVDVSRVRREPGPNAYATVFLDETGNKSFGRCEKGVSLFTPDLDDLEFAASHDVVHLCETARLDPVLPMLGDVSVSYDFSDREMDFVVDLLPLVDVATFSRPNDSEADVEELLVTAHRAGVELVLVTRGEAGAILSDGLTRHHQETVASQIVDTLGAGDAFIAVALIEWIEGSSIRDLAARAASYAAQVCEYQGAFGYGRPLIADGAELL